MQRFHISGHSRRMAFTLLACLTVAAGSLLAGCGGSGNGNANTTSFATAYAGIWSGQWHDVDGTNGTSTMSITLNSTTKAATVNIALSGDKFGFAGSQTALTGSYNKDAITVTGPSGTATVANLTIAKSGLFTGLITNVSPTVNSINFGGPSTSQSATLNVTVHNTDGTTDTGTITLTKPN
ncbi:MAG: hypothetical protein JWN14_2624 [Chthonomonadales bacterium]|nr:hypothetical protein [Chthonomonadales bacterium]